MAAMFLVSVAAALVVSTALAMSIPFRVRAEMSDRSAKQLEGPLLDRCPRDATQRACDALPHCVFNRDTFACMLDMHACIYFVARECTADSSCAWSSEAQRCHFEDNHSRTHVDRPQCSHFSVAACPATRCYAHLPSGTCNSQPWDPTMCFLHTTKAQCRAESECAYDAIAGLCLQKQQQQQQVNAASALQKQQRAASGSQRRRRDVDIIPVEAAGFAKIELPSQPISDERLNALTSCASESFQQGIATQHTWGSAPYCALPEVHTRNTNSCTPLSLVVTAHLVFVVRCRTVQERGRVSLVFHWQCRKRSRGGVLPELPNDRDSNIADVSIR